MADLLCCPFCGSDAFVLSRENRHWAHCNNDECGAETQGKTTHSDAVTAWNTCSTPSDAVAEREAEPVDERSTTQIEFEQVVAESEGGLFGQLDRLHSELEALRKRVDEIDAHRRIVLAENERLLNALIERDRRVAELEKALEEAREVVDACAGDNRPARSWAVTVRDGIDAVLAARRVREGGKVE
jgi:predicted RNase H-like nuclease (RuvC/YqgF family)